MDSNKTQFTNEAFVPDPELILWKNYSRAGSHYDEAIDENGKFRPLSGEILGYLDSLQPFEYHRYIREIDTLLKQNGVTYNIYGDPEGIDRLWALDPLPHVVRASDWEFIERGLKQRAELINHILSDIYSERKLIKQGLLPPELVFYNPDFLWSCTGFMNPAQKKLVIYAVDVARSSGGKFYVMGDRTQVPTGYGYAFENRNVISRVIPKLYRESGARKIIGFFGVLLETLRDFSPDKKNHPFIVLLSPGPVNETYFEHVYIANYLGITLVQAGDLEVKENSVWFRSLSGRKKVNVIIRRVNDSYCDPLDFRGDSLLGVPGLLQAVRSGNVSVVNPLGTGVMNPGFYPFLPAICKAVFGEELLIESVPTHWPGDMKQLSFILKNLRNLVIKPVYLDTLHRTVFGEELDNVSEKELKQKILYRPRDFVGQEKVSHSTTPLLLGNKLESRHMSLRCFLVANKNEYSVMAGGLTRVSREKDNLIVSNQFGGISKDTWILGPGQEKEIYLSPPSATIPVFLKGEPVSGRIADNLFWFGRYSKRCENNVRLLRKIFAHIVSPEEADSLNEKTMLEILRIQTGALPENFIIENIRHAESINILVTYLFRDSLRPGSFIFNLKSMIYSARNIRNLLSDDIWHVINSFDLEVSWIGENPAMIIERLGRLMIGFSALRGLCQENLNKGIGWRFWDIGVSIEKATNTLTLLEHTLNSNENQRYLWQLLLDIEESFITPGLNYHMDWTSISLLGLFLQDETNPRSVISQLLNIQNHLAHLPSENEMYNETRKITLDCLSRSRIFEAMSDKVLNEIDSAGFARIPSEILALIRTLSENMGRTYFDFEDRTRQLI